MNYQPAVEAALQGDESGFSFLYETTYRDMYYVALKYLKNEDAAQDVLQDAYLKAWKSLSTLKEPNNFPAWLGRIVANTAKNQLAKKNPLLFSETEQESEDGDSFVYEIEDDSEQYQPELKYSAEEIQTLVREMIGSLSDEQRMCVIMYYLEGQSVRDIAEALEVSENTVKSRLHYSRKALKKKAEELQKRGYELYGISPIFLLLRLMETEQTSLTIPTAAETVGRVLPNLAKHAPTQAVSALKGSAGAGSAAQAVSAGSAASKTAVAFLHTAMGKAIAGITAVAIIGGGTAAVALRPWSTPQEPVVSTVASVASGEVSMEPEIVLTPTPVPTEAPTPTPVPGPRELRDEEYSQLISGSLTKEDLEYLLANGPQTIPEGGFTGSEDSTDFLYLLLPEGAGDTDPIRSYGVNENYESLFSAEDVTRFFSALHSGETLLNQMDFSEDGQYVEIISPTTGISVQTTINSTEYDEAEKEIRVCFTYDYHHIQTGAGDQSSYVQEKIAILTPDETGLYRITKIEFPPVAPAESAAAAYEAVLNGIAVQNPAYTFPEMTGELAPFATGEYRYCLYDMDGDGSRELVVGGVFSQEQGAAISVSWHVYSCEKTEEGYVAQPAEGNFYTAVLYVPHTGAGLYRSEFMRMNGRESIYRVILRDGTVLAETEPEQTFTMGDADSDAFYAANRMIEWSNISDRELLESTELTAAR